jgi:superfamily II DNA helicase RecQ
MPSRRNAATGSQVVTAMPRQHLLNSQQRKDIKLKMTALLSGRTPCDFQLLLVQAQEEGRDAMCQASTGSGKTAVAAGPYALESNKGKFTLMVSPLIGLQNEMVRFVSTLTRSLMISRLTRSAMIFISKWLQSTVRMTDSHQNWSRYASYDDTSDDIFKTGYQELSAGTYNIVLVLPEMMLSRQFIGNIFNNSPISKRIYSVVVDEAHCISNWGAQFRKKYGQLGMARAFLPQGVPFIALSASITPRV